MLHTDLERARAFFAEEIRAVAHLPSSPVADAMIAAFARVPREAFVGPGPWHIGIPFEPETPYRVTPDARTEHVYHDVVVALDTTRQLNNGQPSALARWIFAAGPRPGESVLHVGCGVGYYTAILAEMVGPTGRVVAREVDATLAERARAGLAAWPQVTVEATGDLNVTGPFDVIFVNAGATHPVAAWLRALGPGGRLFMPLTVHIPRFPHGIGLALVIERTDATRWPIRVVSQIGIYDCEGARDPAAEAQLMKLLSPEGKDRLRFVTLETHEPGPECTVHTAETCVQA